MNGAEDVPVGSGCTRAPRGVGDAFDGPLFGGVQSAGQYEATAEMLPPFSVTYPDIEPLNIAKLYLLTQRKKLRLRTYKTARIDCPSNELVESLRVKHGLHPKSVRALVAMRGIASFLLLPGTAS